MFNLGVRKSTVYYGKEGRSGAWGGRFSPGSAPSFYWRLFKSIYDI